jgi:hypothetical protein
MGHDQISIHYRNTNNEMNPTAADALIFRPMKQRASMPPPVANVTPQGLEIQRLQITASRIVFGLLQFLEVARPFKAIRGP